MTPATLTEVTRQKLLAQDMKDQQQKLQYPRKAAEQE